LFIFFVRHKVCLFFNDEENLPRCGTGEEHMRKARLIKKQEIRDIAEREITQGETQTMEGKKAAVALIVMPGRTKRQDPRKAFAELFAQPQTR
jgi:hypothetical protein